MNIVVPGDPNVMADAMRSLVMVLGTSSGGADYVGSMVKMGLMVSLLITLIQGVLLNSFRLDKLLLHFVLVVGMFFPTTSVTIESNVDSGGGFGFYAPQVVDDVPLVAALPLSVGTKVGNDVATKIDQAFKPSWEDPFFCGGGERCSKLVVFNNLLANFSARFNGLDRDAVLSRNMAEFGRYCDPAGAGPSIKEYLRKDVVAQWSNYCGGITSEQKIIWADFSGTASPKVGPRGELLSSTGVPLSPNKTCVEACRAVGDVLNSDDVLLFSGCKPGSECYTKSNDIFERVLYINAQLGLESNERAKRNFVFACAIDSLTDSDQPIGPKIKDYVAQSQIGDTGCSEWAARVRAKLIDTEQKIKSAASTSMHWLVLLSGIMPLIMLASTVSMAWLAKMLPTYLFYLLFISSPNIVFSVSDAMFASQAEAVFRTAFSNTTPNSPGEAGAANDTKLQCDGDPTCHINTASVLMQVANAAEASADFQSKGNLALLGILSAIGGLSAAGMAMGGGGGGSAGSGAGSSAGANGLGQGAMAGASAVMDAKIGGNLFGAGGAGIMSGDALSTAASFRSMAPGLMSQAGIGSGAGVGAGKASAESSSGIGSSMGTDSSAGESFAKGLSQKETAGVQQALDNVKSMAQQGSFSTVSALQNSLAAQIANTTGKSLADAQKIAGGFVASLDGQLKSGGGKGLGDMLKDVSGKGAGQNLGNMLPTGNLGLGARGSASNENSQTGTNQKGVQATGTEGTNASVTGSTSSQKTAAEQDAARTSKSLGEAFEQTASKQLQAAENARQGQTSDSSMRTGSSFSMPSSGDIAGFNALQMIQSGVRDSAGARDFMMGQLAKGGLDSGQINSVMSGIDQQMERNQAFGNAAGQTSNLLASAGAALQNMAVKGDEGSRRTALQAGLALIGQGGAARDFGAQMAGMDGQRSAIEGGASATLAKGDALKQEVGGKLDQGMRMANETAGALMAGNSALGAAVKQELQKAASGSTAMNRQAVDQAMATAFNRVAGSNLNAVDASQALALANQAAKDGVGGLVTGIAKMAGVSEDAVKGAMAAAGALTAAGTLASGGAALASGLKAAGAAAAGQVAPLAVAGAIRGGAAGAAMSMGARVAAGVAMAARVGSMATPVGAIAAAVDLAVGAATGQTLSSRAVDAVSNGISKVFGGESGQPPAAAPAAAAQDAGNVAASAGSGSAPSPAPAPGGNAGYTPAPSISPPISGNGGPAFTAPSGGAPEGGAPMFGGGMQSFSSNEGSSPAMSQAGAATGEPSMASASPAAASAPVAFSDGAGAGSGTGEPSMASASPASESAPVAFSDAGQGLSGAGSLPDLGIMGGNSGGGSSSGGFAAGGAAPATVADAGGAPRGVSALTQGGAPVGGASSDGSAVPVGGGQNGPVV